MPKVILYEKAKKKIRDNKRHRYNAYDAYVHFLYQKKYKINSELSDLYMRYLGELKTWVEFKEALPKLQPLKSAITHEIKGLFSLIRAIKAVVVLKQSQLLISS